MSIKYMNVISLSMLVALTGTQSWGAAAPERDRALAELPDTLIGEIAEVFMAGRSLNDLERELDKLCVVAPRLASIIIDRMCPQLVKDNGGSIDRAFIDAVKNDKTWAIGWLLGKGASVHDTFRYYINGEQRLYASALQMALDYDSYAVAAILRRHGGVAVTHF